MGEAINGVWRWSPDKIGHLVQKARASSPGEHCGLSHAAMGRTDPRSAQILHIASTLLAGGLHLGAVF
jgi:hypothetical protein